MTRPEKRRTFSKTEAIVDHAVGVRMGTIVANQRNDPELRERTAKQKARSREKGFLLRPNRKAKKIVNPDSKSPELHCIRIGSHPSLEEATRPEPTASDRGGPVRGCFDNHSNRMELGQGLKAKDKFGKGIHPGMVAVLGCIQGHQAATDRGSVA